MRQLRINKKCWHRNCHLCKRPEFMACDEFPKYIEHVDARRVADKRNFKPAEVSVYSYRSALAKIKVA